MLPGYVLAFLLGALAMTVVILLYMRHLSKKLEFEIKLQMLSNGEDPQATDEMLKGMEKWWKNLK